MANIEKPRSGSRQVRLSLLAGRAAQHLAALTRRVVQVNHEVAEGIGVEPVVLRRQFDPPAAHRAGEFERQVPLVPEAQLEQASVVLAA